MVKLFLLYTSTLLKEIINTGNKVVKFSLCFFLNLSIDYRVWTCVRISCISLGWTMLLSLKHALCCIAFVLTWWSYILDTFQTLLFEWEMWPRGFFLFHIFLTPKQRKYKSHRKCQMIIWSNTYLSNIGC